MVRLVVIVASVVAAAAVAAGLGVLIWWLVATEDEWIDTIPNAADFARIPGHGNMFWWFFPALASEAGTRPLILWLDGVTGDPPSLLANFGMFGPFNFNLERRPDSWVEDYNLLFVDAPLGTGFSTIDSNVEIHGNIDNNTEHLIQTLESFYTRNEEFADAPVYIFGQGYGAQLAVSLALGLAKAEKTRVSANVKGVVLSNGIVSPALALTQLGFYLEELGYIDNNARPDIDNFTNETKHLVDDGQLGEAYDKFLSLNEFVNIAGATAVNLGHIVEKLKRNQNRDIFGQKKYLRDVTGFNTDFNRFMTETVAPALGISEPAFDSRREDVIQAHRDIFMRPATDKVEEILEKTNLTVTIINGNLDAVSNTPGQLQWVNNLQWTGQNQFLHRIRQTLVVNRLVEGYFRQTLRLTFYWMNAAGLSVPLDSPVAMRRVLQRIVGD